MENKSQKILLIAVIAVLIILLGEGIMIFSQQKDIKDLKNQVFGVGNLSLPPNNEFSPTALPAKAEATKNALLNNEKTIVGVVKAASDKSLSVEADIVDFSKFGELKETDFDKSTDTLPKTKKTYKVSVPNSAEFVVKAMKSIIVGDTINITANELVYQTSNLTAARIICPSNTAGQEKPQPSAGISLQDLKSITGKVAKIGDNYLIVDAVFPDAEKIKALKTPVDPKNLPVIKKSYKVMIDGKTEFPAKKLKEIKTGDIASSLSDKPVFAVSEFIAIRITVAPVP